MEPWGVRKRGWSRAFRRSGRLTAFSTLCLVQLNGCDLFRPLLNVVEQRGVHPGLSRCLGVQVPVGTWGPMSPWMQHESLYPEITQCIVQAFSSYTASLALSDPGFGRGACQSNDAEPMLVTCEAAITTRYEGISRDVWRDMRIEVGLNFSQSGLDRAALRMEVRDHTGRLQARPRPFSQMYERERGIR